MKKIVWRYWLDYEREEEWLNCMAAKGLALQGFFFTRYEFTEAAPGEYCYRIEYLPELASHPKSEEYLRFLEETGVAHIASYLHWVYLRRKSAEGGFELFSDLDSRLRHYQSVLGFEILSLLLTFFIALLNFGVALNSAVAAPVNVVCGLLAAVLFLCIVPVFFNKLKRVRQLKREKSIRE